MLQRTKVARKAQRIFISNLLQLILVILASFTSNSHAGVYFPSFRTADDKRLADKQRHGCDRRLAHQCRRKKPVLKKANRQQK
jgi:hypothetical protein